MSKKRKVVSGIHLPFCVILLAEKEVCYMSVKKSETALAERIGRKKLRGIKYLLLAVPFLIYVFAFSYVAALVLLITSFNIVCVWLGCIFAGLGQKFLDFGSMVFVGLGNFQKLFTERSEVLRVLRNTLALSALGLLATPVPVVFAIMFNEIKNSKFKKIVQTATTLPNFISWIIVYGVAFAFFSVNGFVSVLMQKIGIQPPVMGILGDVDHTWVLQWILGIWKSFGWSAIIYIAAITGIDSELYDAAKVDGANAFQRFKSITLPMLTPTTFFVSIMLTIACFKVFDLISVMTNGGPGRATNVLVYHIYNTAFINYEFGYASAISMVLFAIVLTITVIQFKTEKKWVSYM